MTRLEELTLKAADGVLTEHEADELQTLLAKDGESEAVYQSLLEIEAALRGERRTLDLAARTVARLREDLATSVERGIMRQLEAEPPPAWARAPRGSATKVNVPALRWSANDPPSRRRPLLSRTAMFAFAASIVALLCVGVWFFGPTMGKPVLGEVTGGNVSVERGTELVPVVGKMPLLPGDIVHIGTNASAGLAFGKEQTKINLASGTELKLLSFASGKRLDLRAGKLEATVARQRPFRPMSVTTPLAEARVLGTEFLLLAEPHETVLEVTKGKVRFTRVSDGNNVIVAAGNRAVAAANRELAALPRPGGILREYWTNVPGSYHVSFLRLHRDFPARPTGGEVLHRFETPSNWGQNYGTRIRGFLQPPITGKYRFWIAAYEGAELYLSRDGEPNNKQQIAYSSGTGRHEWANGNQSAALTLVAGRKYYIEALHKHSIGEDHLAVAWEGPGREREIIPGEFLSPFETNPRRKER